MALPEIVAKGRTPLFAGEPAIAGVSRTMAVRRADTVDIAPVELDVVIPDQERSNWCWAAVAAGIADAYRDPDPPTQCQVASAVFTVISNKPVTCCANGSTSDCDAPRKLSNALRIPGHEHLTPNNFFPTPPKTPWKFIRDKIEKGNPIAIRIAFPSAKAGHFLALTGYDVDTNGGQHVLIGDPAAVTGSVPLRHLLNGYLGGSWHSTYVTTGKQPVPAK